LNKVLDIKYWSYLKNESITFFQFLNIVYKSERCMGIKTVVMSFDCYKFVFNESEY